MALARYESVAVNTAGDVIPNATVEVRRDQPGRPVVPLWDDRNGTVPLGNPITTDAEGKFGFHVTGGSYYIRVFTGPAQQPLQQYVRRYQAIGTAGERDVENLATALEAGTASFPTLTELQAFTPSADEGVGGKVTVGIDAGFYHYEPLADAGERWVFDRPLFDTLARMNVTGGTADAIEAETASGVADSAVVMLWIEAPGDNTGAVTINGKEVLTAAGRSLIAGQWNEGRTYWFSDEGANYKLRTESDVDGIATQVEIWANETLANKNYAEEWAQSDAPISVEAGGDGVNDKSSKAWAGESEDSAVLAAGYAAGLNIAPILAGDGGKVLRANAEEDGSEWTDGISSVVAGNGIAVDNTNPTAPVVAGQQSTTTNVGVVELATSSETIAGTDAQRAVTPAGHKATRIAFKAHNNNVNQNLGGVDDFYAVTFSTEEFDVGNYYNPTNSRWTPPAGIYRVSLQVRMDSGIADTGTIVVAIFKNGVISATNTAKQSGSGAISAGVAALIQFNGTDYISAFAFGTGAGTKVVSGMPAYTQFSGEAI